MEESQLEERLKEIRMQRENIAKVIAANSGKTEQDVAATMQARMALRGSPETAKRPCN